jgi:hypothetical protein
MFCEGYGTSHNTYDTMTNQHCLERFVSLLQMVAISPLTNARHVRNTVAPEKLEMPLWRPRKCINAPFAIVEASFRSILNQVIMD